MENNLCNEAKKVNLEELSKEDLVKKCRGLLTIAQKAKQAKDVIQEENNRLKRELAEKANNTNDVSQEIIEKLTQQKLTFVTNIEELKARNSALDSKLQIFEKELEICQEKLYTTDNENVSYKRQVTRLTDENEQLLTHLETLEKQIDELNKVGIQQQEQLLELEAKAKESAPVQDDNKVIELQRMLSIGLEEVKKLKSENIHLNGRLENLQINLAEKDKSIVVISQELQSKCDILNKVTEQLNELNKEKERSNELVKQNENLKRKYEELKIVREQENFEEKIQELENLNSSLKSKIRLYHSKIVKFAGIAKVLREEKNRILQLFKVYTDQVKEWKEQLQEAGQKLIEHVNAIELENNKLREDTEESKKLNVANDNEEKRLIEKKLQEAVNRLDSIKIEYETEKDLLKSQLKEIKTKYAELREIESSVGEYKNQIESLSKQKEAAYREFILEKNKSSELINEISLVKQQKENINKELLVQQQANTSLINEMKSLKEQNDNIKSALEEYKAKSLDLRKEIENLVSSNKEFKNEINALISEKKSINIVVKEKEAMYKKELEENRNLLTDIKKQNEDLRLQLKSYEDNKHIEAAEKELSERSCLEIKKLAEENKELNNLNSALQERLDEIEHKKLNVFHCECQTDEEMLPTNDYEEQISNLKRENAELLSEMTEMNEVIKDRGESISRLEVHLDEIKKKLQIYEAQANKNVDNLTQKEELIKNLTQEIELLKSNQKDVNLNESVDKNSEIENLRNEIDALKEKLNANFDSSYAESETMSTSTISRTEDANRLKDLEGSWEEKYSKLRNLAVKLKGKVRELTNTITKEQNEKDELQKKISTNLKTIQSLQSQSDKLEDDLESSKKECKQYLDRLNTIAQDISKDKQLLVSKDDIISELKREVEGFKNDKQATDNWKKQVSAKVQTLRKELEMNSTLKKEFENKVLKLTIDLEEKEKALKTEIESHKQTKNQLDLSNNECKKNSVLSLEMQDYERSVKETSKKLEKNQEQITNLKGQVESHKTTISALREQNKLLEERVQEVETELNSSTTEIVTYKKKVAQLEDEIQQKDDKIQSVNQLLEVSRSENEELSTELSKVIAEHQKTNGTLKSERDVLRSQAMGLQQNLREVQDVLRLKEDELRVIQKEYEGYKVRAQSVLRQNQSRDVGLEEKISEEMETLRVEKDKLKNELEKNLEKLKEVDESNEKLTYEKGEANKKIQELEVDIEDLKNTYAQLSMKHQKCLAEHTETVRSLKLHAETLSQCYRQQITELETRHSKEIEELQSRLDRPPAPVDSPPVPPTAPREEGEGSESVESGALPSVHPVPLERLLGSDDGRETASMKRQLNEQESKLAHLTALLSDTEQDLAKHVQMNMVLKEEIRRQQRSLEREQHAENLEYLKNVVFKFVTLNNGDEKSRLVPVLNTILKLSPEETHKLNSVAKGESGAKGWANYLPTWSSPNKP